MSPDNANENKVAIDSSINAHRDLSIPPSIEIKKTVYAQDGKISLGVGRGVGFEFVKDYVPEAKHTLSIASGYFYLSGYNIIREKIDDGIRIRILVGQAQGKEAIKAVLSEIERQLGHLEMPIYDVVQDVANRMRRGLGSGSHAVALSRNRLMQ